MKLVYFISTFGIEIFFDSKISHNPECRINEKSITNQTEIQRRFTDALQPEDVIENDFGRAIADNAGTKIFLQNTEQASEKIKNVMAPSDLEADMLKSFGKGECLFLTKDYLA